MSSDGFGKPVLLLASLWLVAVCATAYQIVPASFLQLAMGDLGIGAAAASWLVSASLAAQAVGNLPIGIVIDRTSNRLILTLAAVVVLVSGVAAWQASLAGSYWGLIGAIVLGGVGIAGIITGGANLVGGTFEGEREATAVAAFLTAAPAGYTIGQIAGPLVASAADWGTNFLVFGGLAGVTFVGTGLLLFSAGFEPADSTRPSLGDFTRLLNNRHVWIVCLLGFLAYSLYLFFNTWMPSYINDQFGLSLATSGLYAALFPAVGILARVGGGVISDDVFDRRRRPVSFLTFVTIIPIILLITVTKIPLLLAALLIPAGFFVQIGIGLFYTYVREVVSSEVTGTALALLGFISFVGAFSAPVVAGTLIQLTGAFVLAFLYAGALAVAGILLTYVAPEPNVA